MGQKKRIVLCGVGFGQFYLRAIKELSEEYELVGIYSRGSEWSQECAALYQVPVFKDLDQITKEITDVACVVIKSTVVGGVGTDIAKKLLQKGIHVIQEHPVHADDLMDCIKLAKMHQCKYSLNTFYPDLKNVADFIHSANCLRMKSPIRYISAECSIHVLFPLIDILGRAAGGLRPWKFELLKPTGSDSPFCIVTGSIHNIPFCIQVQNQLEPRNPENHLFLLHRIVLTTNSGNLIMTGTNGMVVWEPCMNKEVDAQGVFRLDQEDAFLELPVYETFGKESGESYRDMFCKSWPASIQVSLKRFHRELTEGKLMGADLQYLFSATAAWKELAQVIGSPEIIEAYEKKALRIKDLR